MIGRVQIRVIRQNLQFLPILIISIYPEQNVKNLQNWRYLVLRCSCHTLSSLSSLVMKRVNMSGISVVYSGEDWKFTQPPCSRDMMCYLERNERLVSWLQPPTGDVHDQLPAIKVKDEYFTISLRMMKAIWRHVRLRKGFSNVERAPYGGLKLKIPTSLLSEKLRTQSRFNVSVKYESSYPEIGPEL